VGGKVHLYYNAEFPPFLDMRHKMSKKSLEDEFVRRYALKLVLHTIFTLNYDFVDEEEALNVHQIVHQRLATFGETLGRVGSHSSLPNYLLYIVVSAV
jgi:hypothetical protein